MECDLQPLDAGACVPDLIIHKHPIHARFEHERIVQQGERYEFRRGGFLAGIGHHQRIKHGVRA